jgi:hypothetical protein
MNSSILRQLWTVVEETQSSVLLKLSDTDLIKQLLRQLDIKNPLSGEETCIVSAYISSRTSLIRDLAQARLA